MLISSKSEYGLLALADIVRSGGSGPVTRTGISERQRIPLPYLTQVLRQLVNGGLLVSNRGPSGGYSLGKSPEDISILDVVTVLQGPVSPTTCSAVQEEAGTCERSSNCGLAGVWLNLKSVNEDVLRQTSLKDIVHRNRKEAADHAEIITPADKLDCIGIACPFPIVKIAEKMRGLKPGQVLEVWADDEGAKADIPAWCTGTGNEFISREEFGSQMKFLIRKAA